MVMMLRFLIKTMARNDWEKHGIGFNFTVISTVLLMLFAGRQRKLIACSYLL